MASKEMGWKTQLTFVGVFFAILFRIAAFAGDKLDVDVYYMISIVELPFFEYTKPGFMWSLMAFWWATSRVLGESLNAHRVVPLILQFVTCVVLVVGLRRFWRGAPYVSVFAVLFFAFSGRAIHNIDYPLAWFSSETLIGAVLFFGFVLASQRDLTTRESLVWILPLLPLAVLCSYTIIVPVFTGLFSVFLWLMFQSRCFSDVAIKLKSVLRLWPCLAIPGIQLLLWFFVPFRSVGKNIEAHNFHYFFHLSGFSADFNGVLGFVLLNSRIWLKGLIMPFFNDLFFEKLHVSQALVYFVFLVAIACTIVYLAWRRRLDRSFVFTLLFFSVTWFAIIFGGVIGQYPYGSARHTGWLLVPLAVIIGFVVADWWRAIEKVLDRDLSGALLATIVLGGSVAVVFYYRSISTERMVNYQAMDLINRRDTQHVLTSGFVDDAVKVLAPAVGRDRIAMGFGVFHGSISDDAAHTTEFAKFAVDLAGGSIDSVAVAAQSKGRFVSLHPSWAKLVFDNFDLTREISSPTVWVAEFRLKSDSSR